MALLLAPVGAHAQSGFILTAPGTSRAACTAITSPVTNQTWCADGTGAPSTYLWKVWNGTTYITVGGGGGGGGGVCGMSGFVTISGTDTTSTVTFGTPTPDTSYIVAVTTTPAAGAPPGVLAWFRNKTVNGFTVEITSAPGAGNSVDVDWIVTFSGGPATCGGAGITGTGTTNTVPLWTSSTTLGNSIIVQPNVTTLEVGSLASPPLVQTTLDVTGAISGEWTIKSKSTTAPSGISGSMSLLTGDTDNAGNSGLILIGTGDGHVTGDIEILVGQTIGGGAFPHAGEILMQSGFSSTQNVHGAFTLLTGCGTVSCGDFEITAGQNDVTIKGGAASNDFLISMGGTGSKWTLTGPNDNTMLWAEDGVTTFTYNQEPAGVGWGGTTINISGVTANASLEANDAAGHPALTVYSPNGGGGGGVGTLRIIPYGSRTSSDGKTSVLQFLEADLSGGHGKSVGFRATTSGTPLAASVIWQLPVADAAGFFTSSGAGVMSIGTTLPSVIFTALGTPTNGTMLYCSDCDPTATLLACTHVGAQTGAFAYRVNGAWKCMG